MRKRSLLLPVVYCLFLLLFSSLYLVSVGAWSNGGYSADPDNPDYGTHDWIAQHALDYLPTNEKQYILDRLSTYLYGTELPDLSQSSGGIGDSTLHHIYFRSNGVLQDDSAADRAYAEYNRTLAYLRSSDYVNAAKYAGVMIHYIADLAVFGHVMGASTDWGSESHHNDYESYVNARTATYSAEFNTYLAFDGHLDTVNAYEAARSLAYNTTFGSRGSYSCTWMDTYYDWGDAEFKNRCGESLSLTVNYVADVLHTLYSAFSPTQASDNWPMFRHNPSRTGYVASTAPNTNETLWTYITGASIYSSPALAYGKLYVGSFDHKVYCLNVSTGAKIWEYAAGNAVWSSPAVVDQRIYVGSQDHKIYCINATSGFLVWSYTTGGSIPSSPVVTEGKVYVGSDDYKVYCLNSSTGISIWDYTTGSYVRSSPAIFGGKVYVGSEDCKVYCLNASTGALKWSYVTGNWIHSSPALFDGKVYVGSYDGNIYCLNASSGGLIWNYASGSYMKSSPAVVDNRVYFDSDYTYKVYSLNATSGSLIWRYTTGNRMESSPAVADGKVYVGSHDGRVYCFNAITGAKIWSYRTGNLVTSSPAIADGKVFVGSYDGKVYAFGANISTYSLNLKTVDWAGNVLSACTVIMEGLERETGKSGWTNFTNVLSGTHIITVKWQGSKVNQTAINLASSNTTIELRCRVYTITFSIDQFKDASGANLYSSPSSFRLTFPNNTVSAPLAPIGSYLIQNGSTEWGSITWQGTNVSPSTSFNPEDGNPSVNCRVYSLQVNPSFKDNLGVTSITPDSWSLTFPNGTTRITSTQATYSQVQHGNYVVESIFWRGGEVINQTKPAIALTENTAWTHRLGFAYINHGCFSLRFYGIIRNLKHYPKSNCGFKCCN